MPEETNKPTREFSIPLRHAQMAIFGAFILLIGLGIGFFVGVNRLDQFIPVLANDSIEREVPANRNADFSLFWKVWDTLDKAYFDKSKLDASNMVYGAIKGMVAAVGDPYTVFLNPDENKVTQEDLSGNFEGVGIQIGFRGTQLAVISPLPGSPAEEVGILAGDYIVGITDKNKEIEVGTGGMTLPEAVQIIRGQAGSEVTLLLLRDGSDQPFEKTIVRKSIDVPSVVTEFVGEDENIAHIKITKFGAETFHEWDKAVIDVLKNSDLEGVILDLRNNPGGYMQAAIDLGGEFLDKGDVVVIEERGNGTKKEFPTDRFGRLTKEKVVVLINGGSASASEILAGALRDQAGIELIGQKSFGKGTIQEPIQLEEGEGLHVTIARWLTPSEYWVHEKGLEPDIVVENDTETIEDEQLQRAIEHILS